MSTSPIPIQALPRACNEALILACLAGEPRHGYQIVLDLEARSGGAFRLKHGTLYPILHRLEQEGFIEGAWSDEGPRGKRKAYTPGASKEALTPIAWLADCFFFPEAAKTYEVFLIAALGLGLAGRGVQPPHPQTELHILEH